jgi:hypothetical protein
MQRLQAPLPPMPLMSASGQHKYKVRPFTYCCDCNGPAPGVAGRLLPLPA